ncbi:MAG: Xaa-Pro peptidase family protein, partial [Desulfurococcaceae archaeon]
KIGIDLSHVSPLQRTILQTLGESVIDISSLIWKKRMIKEAYEINAIRDAIKITIRGINAVSAGIRDNTTETELTGLFEKTVRDSGVERLAFDPIIAFKPNNAYPHTIPTKRTIGSRDLVLVDVGVKVRNRCSDITRMIIRGRPTLDERKHIQSVIEVIDTSIDYVRPGVRAGEVYDVAVKILEKYGLKDRFIHGLGHGIGVVVHEPPYIRAGSDTVLEPGMVFTIEPGIYIPGKHGVRIEEVVLVTKRGCKVLSSRLNRVLIST